ncbi:MAG: NAD(P)H-dependent oxidoreductase [Mariprofundaceae bacterium]|nr:NAD(P)H-dependent oxidoreductase [Mariprofundaceae bacterium]
MKILAFAASSSKDSINKQLIMHIAQDMLSEHDVQVLDLNDYELPLFSVDREKELGKPALAKAFLAKIAQSDGVIISFAEHNHSYSVAYKNLFDWCSRIQKVFQHKPMIFLATSPGGRGGANVLAEAVRTAPFFDGDVRASLSIASFQQNFDSQSGQLSNAQIRQDLEATLKELVSC